MRVRHDSGNITEYSTSDCFADASLERAGWYCYNSKGSTHPVGLLEPNRWGLFDMLGNANEWTSDHNTGRPPATSVDPGAILKPEVPGIMRGGLFNSYSYTCRAAASLIGSIGALDASLS